MKMTTPTTSLLVTGLSTIVPTEQSCRVQSTGSVRGMATGVTQNRSAKVRTLHQYQWTLSYFFQPRSSLSKLYQGFFVAISTTVPAYQHKQVSGLRFFKQCTQLFDKQLSCLSVAQLHQLGPMVAYIGRSLHGYCYAILTVQNLCQYYDCNNNIITIWLRNAQIHDTVASLFLGISRILDTPLMLNNAFNNQYVCNFLFLHYQE